MTLDPRTRNRLAFAAAVLLSLVAYYATAFDKVS